MADLIARLFRVNYTLRGASMLLHRMGFSPQMPAHRPIERDEDTIATWREEVWRQAKI
ncbi:winged helix-turn-helix domain-containing protein [Saccharopolyspora erythraea]|nr:winged helix-turn-helix domain-containing protein [Saccharopolyspora erythraea]